MAGSVAPESSRTADVIIIGGGAAGLATAIFAGRSNPSARIVLLEGARKIGAKILVSGGGRCNVTNVTVEAPDFCGGNPRIVKRVLKAFSAQAARAFFESLGVSLKEEEYGKLFPCSNKSRTVLDALIAETRRVGVDVHTACRVDRVSVDNGRFIVATGHTLYSARRVVLATGGRSLPKTGSDGRGYGFAEQLGHSVVPTTPALAPLVLSGPFHAALSGVSHPAQLVLAVPGQRMQRVTGPLLWTHFGISGPAALDMSRHWLRERLQGPPFPVAASFIPNARFEQIEQEVLRIAEDKPRLSVLKAMGQIEIDSAVVPLVARLREALLDALHIDPQSPMAYLSRDNRRRIVHALLAWPLAVIDSRGYGFAEVTAGGVALDEIDPATMASRCCKGLFLVGEVLDVDGRLGGFNFQWAWSSGCVAGRACVAGL
jgi:hypothetical protein